MKSTIWGDLAGADVGVYVAHDLLWHPHVASDQFDQRLVDDALAEQLADRQQQPLVEHLGGGGREAHAADVGQVGDAHGVGDQPALAEQRPHHADVEQVAGADDRVVGDDDVARPQRLGREAGQHVRQGHRRGADEDRDGAGALHQQPPLAVEQHHRQVVALAHDGRERGTDQGLDDLVRDRDQAVPEDPQGDGIEIAGAHAGRSSVPPISATSSRRWST
jgi:hypothetical protein